MGYQSGPNNVLRSIWEACVNMSTYCIASDYLLFDFLLLFSIQRQQVVENSPAELGYLTYSIPNTLLLDTMCVYRYDDRTRTSVLSSSRFPFRCIGAGYESTDMSWIGVARGFSDWHYTSRNVQ